MLIYDPVERAAATDLLSHPYILSVPEVATATTGGGAASSSTLGATAGLVNAAAKAAAPAAAPPATSAVAPGITAASLAANEGVHAEGDVGSSMERRSDVSASTKVR